MSIDWLHITLAAVIVILVVIMIPLIMVCKGMADGMRDWFGW